MVFSKSLMQIASRLLAVSHRSNGRPAISLQEVGSVLCIELTRMGDVVSMIPALRALKKRIPEARVSVAVDKRYEVIFRFVPEVDEIVSFENTRALFGITSAVKRLRRKQYDLVSSMSPSYRNALAAAAVQAKAKVGYFASVDSLTPFLVPSTIEGKGITPFVSLHYNGENLYERSLKICKALGIADLDREPALRIPEDDGVNLRRRLTQRGFNLSEQYIILHPFAGWEFRYWKLEAAAEFANRMTSRGIRVVIIGDEHEVEVGEKLMSMIQRPSHVVRAFGLPFDELIVLLQHAQVFVGTDSGPLHLAAALHLPVVGLYGPAHPNYTAPHSPRNSYIFKQVECSPCNQRTCVRPDNPCMHLITSDEVLDTVTRSMSISQ